MEIPNEKIEDWKESMEHYAYMSSADPEKYHGLADDLIVDILRELNLEDIADAYSNVSKWYS